MIAGKRVPLHIQFIRLTAVFCGIIVLAGQVTNDVLSPSSFQVGHSSKPKKVEGDSKAEEPFLSIQRILIIDIEKAEKTKSGPTTLLRSLKQLTDTQLRTVHYMDPVLRELAESEATRAIIIGGQGTPWWLYTQEEIAQVTEVIRKAKVPVLGICGGHQLIAKAFGAPVAPIRAIVPRPSKSSYEGYWRERGWVQVKFLADDEILFGCDKSEWVWQNHCEEVKAVPENFVQLAAGAQSRIQMIRNSTKQIYGCQFHPERWTSQHSSGRKILKNFLSIAGVLTGRDQQSSRGTVEKLQLGASDSHDQRPAPMPQ